MADAPEPLLLRRSAPLSEEFVQAGVGLVPESFLGIGKLQFVADHADRLFHQAVGMQPPPLRSMVVGARLTFAWLAPAEWLVTGPEHEVVALLRHAEHIAGDLGLPVDLTHARASFLLAGSGARDRLAAVTSLDVSDRSFAAGCVARAPLGDTTMFLARLADLDSSPRFRVIVDQTMAIYAVRMLAEPGTDSTARTPS